ncbi:MAG: HypC/HybG/HupF family hydrogenase formation chaperone [Candidatus Woesearchaeota archaeon]
MRNETYFLRYAYPCLFVIKQRGEIDDALMEKLRLAAAKDEPVDRALLEKVFFRAFKRMKKVADEMKKSVWDVEVIKDYFLGRHNMIIDAGLETYEKAPETLKKLCRVREGKIVALKKGALVVDLNGERRPVNSDFVPDAKVGDRVTVHYGYAVEKL